MKGNDGGGAGFGVTADDQGTQPEVAADDQGTQPEVAADDQGTQPEVAADDQGTQPEVAADDQGTQPGSEGGGGASRAAEVVALAAADDARAKHVVQVLPPIVQSLAAIAASVTLTFALRQPNVALSYVVAALALAIVLVVGAGVWAWRASTFLDRRLGGATIAHTGSRKRWLPNPLAKGLALLTALALLALGSVTYLIFQQGIKPIPNYSSAYDGLDPASSGCADDPVRADVPPEPLLDVDGRDVGTVSFEMSYPCSTIWVAVTYSDPSRHVGKTAIITAIRPEDGAKATFKSRPRTGGTRSRGNMLYNGLACVKGEVELMDNSTGLVGKKARLPCTPA